MTKTLCMFSPHYPYRPKESAPEISRVSGHPAECGKIIRSIQQGNDNPWAAVGIKFDVVSIDNSITKLITINGRKQEHPADWQTIIVTGMNRGKSAKYVTSQLSGRQSTSNY